MPALRASAPTRLFLLQDEWLWRDCSPTAAGEPDAVAGYCLRRRHGDYLVVGPHDRVRGLAVTRHEHVHHLLRQAIPRPPFWLDEGLAELLSTCATAKGQVEIGLPLDHHLAELKRQPLLPLGTLLTATRSDAGYRGGYLVGPLYSQSWALVHLLVTGEPELRQAFGRYLGSLRSGHDPQHAWTEEFGLSDQRIADELARRVSRRALPTVRVPPGELPLPAIELTAAEPARVFAALGDLQLALPGRPRPQAERNFWRAHDLDLICAEAHLGLAEVAERFARPDLADREQAAALEAAPEDAWLAARVGWQLLGRVKRRLGSEKDPPAGEAVRAAAAGELERAQKLFRRALTISPEHPLALAGLEASAASTPPVR